MACQWEPPKRPQWSSSRTWEADILQEHEDPRIRQRVFTGFKNVTTLIKQALLALPSYDRSCIEVINQYPFCGKMHHLHNNCMRHPKGSSFVYKALIDDKANRQGLNTPLACITSQKDQNHGMTEDDWKHSLKHLSKIHSVSLFDHTFIDLYDWKEKALIITLKNLQSVLNVIGHHLKMSSAWYHSSF